MNALDQNVQEDTIVKFLEHIESIGGVLKAVAGDELQAVVEFRPSGNRVLMDLTTDPVKVSVGRQGIDGSTGMAGTVEDLHDAFIGKLNVIEGIGQRRLLTKGAMSKMVSFFPVLGLTPVLYADFLWSNGKKPGAIRRGLAAFIGFFYGIFAWFGGLLLRGLKRRELLVVLNAMSRGSARFSPLAAMPKKSGKKPKPPDHPLAIPRPSLLKRAWMRFMSFNMYVSGWFISLFRYKLGLPIDLFRVLAKLARGIGRVEA